MINLNKGVSTPIAITIIVVLVVLVGGGVLGYQYYWLPKQEVEAPKTEIPKTETSSQISIETPKDETADRKTYRNEEYGFEIKYPDKYNYLKEDMSYPYSGGLAKVKALSRAVIRDNQDGSSFFVIVSSMDSYRFLNTGGGEISYDFSKNSCVGDLFEDYEKENKFNFQGSKGCYIGDGDARGVVLGYLIPDRENRRVIQIIISFSIERLDTEEVLQDLNNIISTFKFIDQYNNDFLYNIGDNYLFVKEELRKNGWKPVIPNEYYIGAGSSSSTPISSEFPEIANCGSGKDAICSVNFQNIENKNIRHLNLQSRYDKDGKVIWIVVGSE